MKTVLEPEATAQHPDPFVEFFVRSDPEPVSLLEGVVAWARSEAQVPAKVEATKVLLELSLGRHRSIDDHVELLDRAYREHSSVDRHILFLMAWFRTLLFVDPRWSRMGVLRDQLRALTTPTTPPEIVGWVEFADVAMMLHEGATTAGMRMLTQSVTRVPPGSPHRQHFEVVRTLHYLQHGMGAAVEVPAQPEARGDATPSFRSSRFSAMMFVNAALTGGIEAIMDLQPVEVRPGIVFSPLDYRAALQALPLMFEQRGKPRPPWHRLGRLGDHEPAWVRSSRYLLQRRPDQALQWARRAISQESPHTTVGLDAYALIRAELSAGHGEAAKRLLLTRKERSSWHYIDDLFVARAELLLGNRDLAAFHWSRLLKAAEEYRAEGRLDFEISLACELTPSACAYLSRRAAQVGVAGEAALSFDLDPPETRRSAEGIERLVGRSAALASLRDRVLTFAEHDAPVLVGGETGTGKELVARALHETSKRRDAPFVAINCAAVSDTLVESELFGYRRGAFTGAQASHDGLFREAGQGTLFLDEIGDISSRLQAALLRVLETGEVRPLGGSQKFQTRCRVIAATNAVLERRVAEGRFRQDLFYRLQRLHIHVPPLRERSEDVIELATRFLDEDRPSGQSANMSEALRMRLRDQPWPGNVRELRNVIERMRVLNSDKLSYDESDFDAAVVAPSGGEQPEPAAPEAPVWPPSEATLEPMEPAAAEASAGVEASRAERANAGETSRGAERIGAAPAESAGEGASASASAEEVLRLLAGGRNALRRRMRLRELFKQVHALKTSEAARLLEVSRHTARTDLRALCEEGVIEKVEPTRAPSTHYYRARS